MARTQSSKFAILGILNFGPASGYDIKRFTRISTQHFWHEAEGAIYPILNVLEQEGLVEKTEGLSAGARPRHVYTITKQGQKAFTSWLALPPKNEPLRLELLLKLFLGREEGARFSKEHIQHFHKRLKALLKTFDSIAEEIPADDPISKLTLRYGQLQAQSVCQWCQEAIKVLEKY